MNKKNAVTAIALSLAALGSGIALLVKSRRTRRFNEEIALNQTPDTETWVFTRQPEWEELEYRDLYIIQKTSGGDYVGTDFIGTCLSLEFQHAIEKAKSIALESGNEVYLVDRFRNLYSKINSDGVELSLTTSFLQS